MKSKKPITPPHDLHFDIKLTPLSRSRSKRKYQLKHANRGIYHVSKYLAFPINDGIVGFDSRGHGVDPATPGCRVLFMFMVDSKDIHTNAPCAFATDGEGWMPIGPYGGQSVGYITVQESIHPAIHADPSGPWWGRVHDIPLTQWIPRPCDTPLYRVPVREIVQLLISEVINRGVLPPE